MSKFKKGNIVVALSDHANYHAEVTKGSMYEVEASYDNSIMLVGVAGVWLNPADYFERTSYNTGGGGTKHDSGKPKLHYMPYPALEEIAKVFTFGANKYGDYNFLKGMDWTRPYNASLRHLGAWFWQESKDTETGLSHLAHAGCNIMMLLAYEIEKLGNDNRYINQKGDK